MKHVVTSRLSCVFSIAIIIFLSGCASSNPPIPSYHELLLAETNQDGRECIRQGDINGYGVLDDELVSVDARRQEYFIITTLYQCTSLNSGFQAGFDGSFGDFCPLRDRIITIDETCPIKGIFKFESKAEFTATFEKIKAIREQAREEIKNLKAKDK